MSCRRCGLLFLKRGRNSKHICYPCRFWQSLDTRGSCWLWKGSKTLETYGRFVGPDGVVGAHVYAWEYYTGKTVPKGFCVLHTCDTPACVRPLHLFLGTQKDNTEDCIRKGRARYKGLKGEAHNMVVLSESDVRTIRALRSEDPKRFTLKLLGKMYKVSLSTIHLIVKRKTWKHV